MKLSTVVFLHLPSLHLLFSKPFWHSFGDVSQRSKQLKYPEQQNTPQRADLCTIDATCFLGGRNPIFKYDLHTCHTSKGCQISMHLNALHL
jgi:hypothetical protein